MKDFKIDPQTIELYLLLKEIDDKGAAALADALLDAKNLRSLDLAGNKIGYAGAAALVRSLPSTSLTSLNLGANKIGDKGAAEIAGALREAKSLAELNLACTNIGPTVVSALAGSLPSTSLTSLNLGWNKIGAAGAAALANFLPSTSLTSLSLVESDIGEVGEAAILLSAKKNSLFLTQVKGLGNSDAINVVVEANRQNLKTTAKLGVCSLVKNHRFPTAVAGMIAGYVNGKDITDEDIKSIREDKEVAKLLAPEEASTPEVASGDDDQKRADYMSRGLSCVIV